MTPLKDLAYTVIEHVTINNQRRLEWREQTESGNHYFVLITGDQEQHIPRHDYDRLKGAQQ